ncbi:hypothetical protein ES705_09987 [subsurface metagenome]
MTRAKLMISGAQFARMAGVKPQSIISAAKSGLVVKIGKDYSLENDSNIAYLQNHGCDISDYIESIQKEEYAKDPENNNVRHRNTGHLEPGQQEESKAEMDKELIRQRTRDFEIRNETRLGNLIPREYVKRILGEISQSISVGLIDLPQRHAAALAALFQRLDLERDGQQFLAKIIETGMESVIERIMKIQNKDNL